ncbi:hypothetical protein [Sporosarcina sp. FSL K6-1508]|uniref:hypothetical protein n=1 Tax=Sporosarcina sp. FSL K6-1508 TaxID=2921553 RepID=UPI0030F85899
MSDNVSSIFNKVFIGALLLINLSLILYILLSSLTINITFEGGKLFGFSDSFYGALLGAVITGSTALIIFGFDVFTRKRSEVNKIKKSDLNNLIKLQFINSQLINLLNFFSDEFSKTYDDEREYKFRLYVIDAEWLCEEARKIETSQLTEGLLKDYLKYNRMLSTLYNELSLFPELPYDQRVANISNFVGQTERLKIDFESFSEHVEILLNEHK